MMQTENVLGSGEPLAAAGITEFHFENSFSRLNSVIPAIAYNPVRLEHFLPAKTPSLLDSLDKNKS